MIERLVAIMARLRDPTRGCEWDTVQTFETIAPYTIEEAYEVADAIQRGDVAELKDELGDLLLQVVFHARIAEESGHFALPDVVAAISDKMERRHPHIFGDAAQGGHHLWEQIKAEERAAKPDASALAGVALGLPALLRAEKLQKRAARTGFDWPDASGARAKVDEELAEVEAARSADERIDEIGDLLFAVVNWSRKLGVDPEAALRGASAKFNRRFRAMEAVAGEGFASLDLAAKEALWVRIKAAEGSRESRIVVLDGVEASIAVDVAFDRIAAEIADGRLPSDPAALRLAVRYTFAVGDVPTARTELPVLSLPELRGEDAAALDPLGGTRRYIRDAMATWLAQTAPSSNHAELVFDVHGRTYAVLTIRVRLVGG